MSSQTEVLQILRQVESGELSADDALISLRAEPFVDLGFARVDHHRALRQGAGEVIYGAGKTPEQISAIAANLLERGQNAVLITRMNAEAAKYVSESHALTYDPLSRTGVIGTPPPPTGTGFVAVLTAGTSDIPVAEEAVLTASFLGSRVERVYDVGVAGIHRLLACSDVILRASVIVVAAGMEGALASVVGGMADCPVIAVPTSVGYGASFGGVAALLSMLNSCASGVSVVNIDNGFGAGYLANMINHIGEKKK